MAGYEAAFWQPTVLDGVSSSQRRPGRYWAYIPDPLARQTPLTLPGAVVDRVAEATAALAATNRSRAVAGLDALATLALRSEAVASSVIEGVQVSARGAALADFTGHGSLAALEVVRNARVMRRAVHEMASADQIGLDDVIELQTQLIGHLPGLRREQVWIGGRNPMDAAYVRPLSQRVPELMDDLIAYLNDPSDAAVVAAAVVHAQFENIHPFRDGNGRVGRAITHTVLSRALGSATVAPFSRVFAARTPEYIRALSAWRIDDAHPELDERLVWIETFADAVIEACALTEQMVSKLVATTTEYRERLAEGRRTVGRKQPRRDSTVLALLDSIAAQPIDTVSIAAQRLGVSTVAARDALDELAAVGVYQPLKIDKGKQVAYVAGEVLAIADLSLSDLAPTGELTTDDAAPGVTRSTLRKGPSRTERSQRRVVCGYPMPNNQSWCIDRADHSGAHTYG